MLLAVRYLLVVVCFVLWLLCNVFVLLFAVCRWARVVRCGGGGCLLLVGVCRLLFIVS